MAVDSDTALQAMLQPPGPIAAPSPTTLPVAVAAYTPAAMVELMISRPDYTHAQLCAHFGRPKGWLSTVLASEAFQQALDPHRRLVQDPSLTATVHERFRALAIRTSNVLLEKLDDPSKAGDFLVVKGAEIAIKALGMDRKADPAHEVPAAPAPATDSLAERIMKMMDAREASRTVDVEAQDVSPAGDA